MKSATQMATEILAGWRNVSTFGNRNAVRWAIRGTELVPVDQRDAVTDAMLPMVRFHSSVPVGYGGPLD